MDQPPVLGGFRPDGTPDPATAVRVAEAWLAGGLVGLPTETVYGLAADAQDPVAVARIYAVKGRPADHPLIVHIQGELALDGWSASVDEVAHVLAERFWPGPLTLVVRRGPRARDFVTGGQDTVALRCPGHPVARACIAALADLSGDPARGVAAPSANRFGRVSPTSAADVLAEIGSHLDPLRDLVVDGGPAAVGVESTIVDCTATPPTVLRLGAVGQAQVVSALAESGLGAAAGCAGAAGAVVRPGVRAPGTLESHYAPSAAVSVVDADGLAARAAAEGRSGRAARRLGLIAPDHVATPGGWVRLAAPRSTAEYAHYLYASLRAADRLGLAEVVVVPPPAAEPGSLGAAIRDRLARAAHRRA